MIIHVIPKTSMSRTVIGTDTSERQLGSPRDEQSRKSDRDRGRHRKENDTRERHSHQRGEEKTRASSRDEDRDERRDIERNGENSQGDRGREGDGLVHNRSVVKLSSENRDDQSSRHRSVERSDGDDERRSSRSHRSHRLKRARDNKSESDGDDDDDRRERKHKKHKKDKKHKHRRTVDGNNHNRPTELDQRIQHTKQQLSALLSPPNPAPHPATSSASQSAVLTADDYYVRSAEFRLWLHNSRSLHLDELDSNKSKQLFDDFCTEWNSGRLPAAYYKGVDSSALSGSVLTAHKWRFVGVMSEADKLANASVRDSVDTATYHHTYKQEFTPAAPATAPTAVGPSTATLPAVPTVSSASSRAFAALSRGEKRQHVQRVEAVMDEVAPRESGREAMLLKRREKGEYSRRERGGDGMEEMDDDVLMGGAGGESELARLKQRESQRRENRNTQQAEKRSEWDRKEKQRMRAMLQSIGQADKYNL